MIFNKNIKKILVNSIEIFNNQLVKNKMKLKNLINNMSKRAF